MDVLAALGAHRTVDITTTGAKSGQPRRIETWTWIDGNRVFLTGTPGPRDWYANVKANPEVVVHVKRGDRVDLPARARPIEDPAERREVLGRLVTSGDVERWIADSPLVELEFGPA